MRKPLSEVTAALDIIIANFRSNQPVQHRQRERGAFHQQPFPGEMSEVLVKVKA